MTRWIGTALRRFRQLWSAVRRTPALNRWLVALLAVDLLFILWWAGTRLLLNLEINEDLYEIDPLRIDKEGGIPEWIGYAKTLVLVGVLGRLAWIERQWIYGALTMLFAFVLVDDSLEIHETGGKFFAKAWDLEGRWGMRPVDFGETVTWLIIGAVLLPAVLLGLLRSERRHLENGLAMLVPFATLVFFGLVVDQLYHIGRDLFFGADIVLGGLEDGGEMISITVALLLAAALGRDPTSAPGGRSLP